MTKTLIFDTETSGLVGPMLLPLPKQPNIIELFATIEADGVEQATFNCLFDPGFKISALITSITGIKNEDLIGQQTFAERAAEIKALLESVDEVVAHNLSFDKAMIDFEMQRAGLAVNWPRLICTVEQTEHLCSHRLSLTKLHEHLFAEPFKGAHRAETDVRALARCFNELRHRGVL